MISDRQLFLFIEQSNMIEGIQRKATDAEFEAHKRFLELREITVADLVAFVRVIQPDAVLRDKFGLNVCVGSHIAPPGGRDIPLQLQRVLDDVNSGGVDVWRAHCTYETIHPFLDGNGRSGRVLWLWQMRGRPMPPGLFLHSFYYQTLTNFRT